MAAEALLGLKFTLDAQYLAGYALECKALTLQKTPPCRQGETLKRITSGAKMHKPEVLLGELRDRGVALPPDLGERRRRFDWTKDLRYETTATGYRRDQGISEDDQSHS